MPLLINTPSVDRAILILRLQNLQSAALHGATIATATACTRTALSIVVSSPALDHVSPTKSWYDVQSLLNVVYVRSARTAADMDKPLLDVDVFLVGSNLDQGSLTQKDWDCVFVEEGDNASGLPSSLSSLPVTVIPGGISSTPIQPPPVLPPPVNHLGNEHPPLYQVVALGGTFDHLHAGHKILLSMAAWISQKKLIVGVTGDALLVKKKHKQVLETISERMHRVQSFLEAFKPGIEYDVVELNDVYGPTAWDPNVQALVVSRETLPGAGSIEKLRAEKSMPRLEVFVIDVISADNTDHVPDAETLMKIKMSSTAIREWIVEKQKSGT